MFVEYGLLTSLITLATREEMLKGSQIDIDEQVKEKILTEGIYHFTTKASAESIVKTGFYLPSKGLLNNHFSRGKSGKFASFVYMFGGKPDLYMLGKNINRSLADKDGTFYAVRHHPDRYDLSNYSQRVEDGAIMYEGRLDVKHNRPELVRFKIEKGQIKEIPLDEKVEKVNIAEKTKQKIVAFKNVCEIVGKEIKTVMCYRDKEHKIKKCKIRRKMEEKLLKQYNEEKNVKMYDIVNESNKYLVYVCDDVVIDGKRLAEAFVCKDKFGEEPLKKVYIEAGKEKILLDGYMKKFFEKGIDFSNEKDEYIGEPKVVDGIVSIKKDEEFSRHFIGKQQAQEIGERNFEEYKKSKNKIGLDFFKKFYENVPEKSRNYARDIIKDLMGKDNDKKIENKEVTNEI